MTKKLICIATALLVVLATFCTALFFLRPVSSYGIGEQQSNSLIAEVSDRVKEAACDLIEVKIDADSAYVDETSSVKLTAEITCPMPRLISLKASDVIWSSSDRSIAEVDQNGFVQARGSGDALITATLPNGNCSSCIVSSYADPYNGASAIPVLTYHRVSADIAKDLNYPDNNLAISEHDFEQQMSWLEENGYTTISTQELYAWMEGKLFLPKKSVLLTFDDGFYEMYHIVYPILRQHNFKGCSFVIGSNISDQTDDYDPTDDQDHFLGQDVIDEIREEYPEFEIQSHTYNLHKRDSDKTGIALNMTESELATDLDLNRKQDFTALAYPFGHVNWSFRNALQADRDIQMAFGYPMTYPVTRESDIYVIPRYKVFGDGTLDDFIAMASSGW